MSLVSRASIPDPCYTASNPGRAPYPKYAGPNPGNTAPDPWKAPPPVIQIKRYSNFLSMSCVHIPIAPRRKGERND